MTQPQPATKECSRKVPPTISNQQRVVAPPIFPLFREGERDMFGRRRAQVPERKVETFDGDNSDGSNYVPCFRVFTWIHGGRQLTYVNPIQPPTNGTVLGLEINLSRHICIQNIQPNNSLSRPCPWSSSGLEFGDWAQPTRDYFLGSLDLGLRLSICHRVL